MTELSETAGNAVTRTAYARPTLVVYGSVRELTGGMSQPGADNFGLNMRKPNTMNM